MQNPPASFRSSTATCFSLLTHCWTSPPVPSSPTELPAIGSTRFPRRRLPTATTFPAPDDVGNLPTQVSAGGYTTDRMLEFSGTATILHPGSGNAHKLKIWVDPGDGNPTVFATVDVDSATGAWSISAPSLGGDAHYA